jgi:hypothetical protein
MKTSILFFCCSTVLGLAVQTPFVNLDFESANLPYITNIDAGIVSATDAFPGWTVWENENVRTEVAYNAVPNGGQVAIFATGLYPFFTLGGLFMAHFGPYVGADCSLSQVGTIPADGQWLQFRTYHLPDYDPLTVSFEGQPLSLSLITSEDPFEKTFRADISAFAASTGELRFNARPVFDGQWLLGNFNIDDIQFVPVPEPHVWALLGLAALALTFARRHRKRM